MLVKYDVVIAGGSVSGLLCAREVASAGHSVLVLEKSHEIGTPQHCGGLLSRAALEYLGVSPSGVMLGNTIESVSIVAPDGSSIALPAMGTQEIDRRELDKQIAMQAQKAGADIQVGTTFRGTRDHTAKTANGDVMYNILVDARGIVSIENKSHIVQSAQCEIHADWIRKGRVSVMLDRDKYPGFFAWIIPRRDGHGKVGVAGRNINATQAMESLLSDLGGGAILRSIIAPIWVGGAMPQFVHGHRVTVGDAAGQTKPTTGGGIYSCGAGGILAGRAIASHLESGIPESLDYGKAWRTKFGAEFRLQSKGRKILEMLDNTAISRIISSIRPGKLPLSGSDFDFHAGTLLNVLGIKGTIEVAGTLAASEIRRILGMTHTSNKV